MKTSPVCLAVLLAMLISVVGASNCVAQSSSLPNQNYYTGFIRFFEGDYKDAERDFRTASRTAYRVGNQRYVDSICYWTMQAECHFHMGNYSDAIVLYEQALRLYLVHQKIGWQSKIQTQTIKVQSDTAGLARARINWGTSSRITGVARVPDNFQVRFGTEDVIGDIQRGGVILEAQLRTVNVTEIMRCVALCLHRRNYIKGPIAKIDPLTSQIVSGMQKGIVDGSPVGCYNGVCLGIAYASQEEWGKASRVLKKSLKLSGGLDHPLTPVGLLQSAYIGLSNDNDAVASTLALEASYSAAVFDQFDLVSEALTVGTMVHLKTNRSVYPPLQNSIAWAKKNNANLMEATSIVRLAECLSEAGELSLSQKTLQRTSQVIDRRNTLAQSVVGARVKYVTALNQFLATDFAGGSKTLAAAVKHFNVGSLWLYRLQLANKLSGSGNATPRQVNQLYETLLHDPTDLDWKIDPFEAITFLATPHIASMERWFETAITRRDMRQAFDIAEQTRRHRFFASLPMGGRLMAFRWLLHAPASALSKNAMKQRANFFNRNPDYKQSVDRAAELETQLKQIPLNAEPKSEDAIERRKLINELAKLSATQETILGSISLRREPAEMVFPPSFSEAQIRSTLRPDQLALVTMATEKGYHFFLLNQKSLQYVTMVKTRTMHREISSWLKAIGGNQASVNDKQITGDDWKKGSKAIAAELFDKVLPDQWSRVKELVIVPDGALWYLPFEALLVGSSGDETLLSEKVGVRYCPTASLAFGGQRPVQELSNLLVLTGNLSPKTDIELATTEYEKIFDAVPEAQEWKSVDVSSNVLGAQIDRLLAWTFIRSAKAPLATAPLSTEKQKLDDASLNTWMKLPWGAPQHIILPGYQSPGISLRGRGVGSDLFLTTTGLMAAGSRTILISRWNTAGKTSFDLTGNYTAKIKSEGNLAALAQARQLVRDSDLDLENEPRLRAKGVDVAIKAEHPFFWSSPMLLGIPDNSESKIGSGTFKRTTRVDSGLGQGGGLAPPMNGPKPEMPDAGLPNVGLPNVDGQPEAGDQPEADPEKPKSIDDVLKGDDVLEGDGVLDGDGVLEGDGILEGDGDE